MVTDREGVIEFVNRGFQEASGYTALEIIGQKPNLLRSGRHAEAVYGQMWTTILQGRVYRGELVNRRRDGRLFRERKVIFPLTDGQGQIVRFVSVGTEADINDGDELGATSPALALLADLIPGFVYRTSVNGLAETDFLGKDIDLMTGFSVEELGRNGEFPLDPLLSAADRERRRLQVSQAAANERPFRVEYAIHRRNGTISHVLECGRSMLQANATSRQTYGVVLDISDRRWLEERLHSSEEVRRALSTELLSVLEHERKRIASELHDDIGQILTSIKMRVEGAIASIAEGNVAAGRKLLGDLPAMIKGTMDEVRRISMDLRPPMIDDLGIVATIGWFCRDLSESHPKLRVELDLTVAESEVPDHLKIVIYRVLQEAMTNVIRHAKADLARVRLARAERNIEFLIQDNGCGFDPASAKAHAPELRGSGLTNMKERVEIVGGNLSLRTIKRHGTVIYVVLPCGA
jgi:PAS domain S-box-containing protein